MKKMTLFLLGLLYVQLASSQIQPCLIYDRFAVNDAESFIILAETALNLSSNCNSDPELCDLAYNLLYDAEDILSNIFTGHSSGGCLDCDPNVLINIATDLLTEAKRLNNLGRVNRIGNIHGTLLQWRNDLCSTTNPRKTTPPIQIKWSPVGTWQVKGSDQLASIQPQIGFSSFIIRIGEHQSTATMQDDAKLYAQEWDAIGQFQNQGDWLVWQNQTWIRISQTTSSVQEDQYPCSDDELSGEHNASLMGMVGVTKLYRHGDTFCDRGKGYYFILKGNILERYEKRNGSFAKVSYQTVKSVKNLDSGKTRYVLDNNDWLTIY